MQTCNFAQITYCQNRSPKKYINYLNRIIPIPPVPRVGILFDAQNLYCAHKEGYGRLDYRVALREALCNRMLFVAKAYVVTHPDYPTASNGFLQTLLRSGIQVHTKQCELSRLGKPLKANLDVELAIDATSLILDPAVNTIVLATGDGDFKSLIDLAHSHNKKVEIMGYTKLMSRHLVRSADKVTYLDDRRFSIKKVA